MVKIPCIAVFGTEEGERSEFQVGRESLEKLGKPFRGPNDSRHIGVLCYKGIPFVYNSELDMETD